MNGRAIAAAALVTVLVGCGPVVTSSGDYRSAGARTAGDAAAQVATAGQAAQLAVDEHAFGSYLAVVVGDAENALTGIQNTFAALQPPTAEDLSVRTEVLDTLTRAQQDVADVRIAVEAGRAPPAEVMEHLAEEQDQLDALAGELQ